MPIESIYGFAKLSGKFLRDNPFFLSGLTVQEQQIFFLPFLEVQPDDYLQIDDKIQVRLKKAKAFLGSVQSASELRYSIKEANGKIEAAFAEDKIKPYQLESVEGDIITYRILDPLIMCNSIVHNQHYRINLDDIANLKNYRKCKFALPVILYLASHSGEAVSADGQPCRETVMGDKLLKDLSEQDKYNYVDTPKYPSHYYEDVDKVVCNGCDYWESKALYDKYHDRYAEIPGAEKLFSDYCAASGGHIEENWMQEFQEVIVAVYRKMRPHFQRYKFEKNVIDNIVKIANAGSFLHFCKQDVRKQAKANEKAAMVRAYYSKNYEDYSTSGDFQLKGLKINGDGSSPDDYDFSKFKGMFMHGKNFRKLVRGKQYRFQYQLLNEKGEVVIDGRAKSNGDSSNA